MASIKCQICFKEFPSYHSIAAHMRGHKMTFKSYYDKYLRSDGDGVCPECQSETNFNRGSYEKYCSARCAARNQKNKTIICKICSGHYSNSDDFYTHLVEDHKMSYDDYFKYRWKEVHPGCTKDNLELLVKDYSTKEISNLLGIGRPVINAYLSVYGITPEVHTKAVHDYNSYVKTSITYNRAYFSEEIWDCLQNINWLSDAREECTPQEIADWENMTNNGYDRIWDSGNKVFVLK